MSSILNKSVGLQTPNSIALLSNKAEKTNIDDGLVELAEALEDIDENKASAKLNEVSMIDNKGGRIYY